MVRRSDYCPSECRCRSLQTADLLQQPQHTWHTNVHHAHQSPEWPGKRKRDCRAAARNAKRLKYAQQGDTRRGTPLFVEVEPDGSDTWRLDAVADIIRNGGVSSRSCSATPCCLHNRQQAQALLLGCFAMAGHERAQLALPDCACWHAKMHEANALQLKPCGEPMPHPGHAHLLMVAGLLMLASLYTS